LQRQPLEVQEDRLSRGLFGTQLLFFRGCCPLDPYDCSQIPVPRPEPVCLHAAACLRYCGLLVFFFGGRARPFRYLLLQVRQLLGCSRGTASDILCLVALSRVPRSLRLHCKGRMLALGLLSQVRQHNLTVADPQPADTRAPCQNRQGAGHPGARRYVLTQVSVKNRREPGGLAHLYAFCKGGDARGRVLTTNLILANIN
jgi:hypothetical protein